ncbi:MAG: LCP family protein [Nocardioidaceae bacterium]|nr:LCP family protein [Nocardioidaceae bacterium]
MATSRADRKKAWSKRGGRRKAPQPGRTVFRVITATLLGLGLVTGLGVVLVYNNWNGNLKVEKLDSQLGDDRPSQEDVPGAHEPINILVMGSDTRSGKGNGIDGESGGGLSDTTILFHVSADREFAYGISIPRDTAVMRPNCYNKDGSEIPGTSGYVKWNEAFAAGGPACTIRQFEQRSKIRISNYVVVDFNGFKDMVNALDGVEVCIPEDIDDDKRNVHLKAGTREIKGKEALTYVRARYRIGDGTDTNRTRRQQAFIGSMINKALTAGILARPDRLIRFMNAATSSLKTDYESIAQMADLAVTAKGIGPENIKFVTTPWVYSDKVSAGIEWKPEVEKLWRLVRRDKQLTPEFVKDSISAADEPDGSPSGTGGTPDGASDGASDGAGNGPSSGSSDKPGDNAGEGTNQGSGGLDSDGRALVGLC